MKRLFKSKWTVTIIFFLIGLFCYMKEYGYAQENYSIEWQHIPLEQESYYQSYDSRTGWGKDKTISMPKQRQKWQDEYDNHHFHAVRTYTDAYNKVWWLPNLTWRQIGRDAWVATCATVGCATVTGAFVTAFSTMISAYGLHCLDEYDYIQEKLYWSEYHFNECKKFAELLHGG